MSLTDALSALGDTDFTWEKKLQHHHLIHKEVSFFFRNLQKRVGWSKTKRRASLSALICWWEKPLVVALKHSEGIKHTVLLQ
jgi:hypothetical protein